MGRGQVLDKKSCKQNEAILKVTMIKLQCNSFCVIDNKMKR
jgi:hypothetical protein